MNPNHADAFCVEVPVGDKKKMEEFQKALDDYQDAYAKYIEKTSQELGISFGDASDIIYLRSRSRWTQEKEDYLLSLAKQGKPLPNMCDDFEIP